MSMSNIFRYIIAQLRKSYFDNNMNDQQALPVTTSRIESHPNPPVCDCCDERWPRDQVARTTPVPSRFAKATLQSV
jgi:hypothetical protein